MGRTFSEIVEETQGLIKDIQLGIDNIIRINEKMIKNSDKQIELCDEILSVIKDIKG